MHSMRHLPVSLDNLVHGPVPGAERVSHRVCLASRAWTFSVSVGIGRVANVAVMPEMTVEVG